QLPYQILRDRQNQIGIIVHRYADLADTQRALAEHVTRAMDQRFTEGAVTDDENTDHCLILAAFVAVGRAVATASSSASMYIFATSKPVWSVISRKQVGLVTLISVM